MRMNRTMQFLTIVATVAAYSAPADSAASPPAAAPAAAAPADPAPAAPAPVVEAPVTLTVHWDSGPLDLAYRHEHEALEARHSREIASPRAGESAERRRERQEAENKALELRYSRGKAAHARTLPPER